MLFYEEVLKRLNQEGAKYVLVGGVAFNLLGGQRNTMYLDLLVEMTNENLLKIVRTLKSLGYRPKQSVNPEDIGNPDIRRSWLKEKHMKAFNFWKEERTYEEVDLIFDSPVPYEQAACEAHTVAAGDLEIPVISADHLIQMKEATGRKRDLLDIEDLRRIKEIGGG